MDVELRTNAVNPALALRGSTRWAAYPCADWRASLELTSGAFAASVWWCATRIVRGVDRMGGMGRMGC